MLLYADENFPLPVVSELRRLGHDVLTAQDDGLRATPDPVVLARAALAGYMNPPFVPCPMFLLPLLGRLRLLRIQSKTYVAAEQCSAGESIGRSDAASTAWPQMIAPE